MMEDLSDLLGNQKNADYNYSSSCRTTIVKRGHDDSV